ncbi:MAG: DUF4381 domain-containing protein [Pseudohongiellaceae bacterium]
MDSEELLAQLADIHLPEPVSFWPPAPGWWVLALLLLIAAIWLIRKVRTRTVLKRIKSQAISELTACYERYSNSSSQEPASLKLRYVNEANGVLKRVALVHFSDNAVAGLGGSEWVNFIRANGNASLLDEAIADALSHGRFKTTIEVDVDAFHEFGLVWITSLYDNPKAKNSEKDTEIVGKFKEVAQ